MNDDGCYSTGAGDWSYTYDTPGEYTAHARGTDDWGDSTTSSPYYPLRRAPAATR